ncbi:MAG: Holliday junction resolvase RuvX [Aquificae bacterium]|nr:Holliday junction resolvase RuvX [Aquificota bacterium]
MKILSIDFGLKRVGLAVGDTDLKIAVPKGTIPNDERLIDKLKKIVEENKVKKIVLGLPLTPSGKEGQRAKLVREFAQNLKSSLPEIEIVLWDERYTTMEAQNRLKELPYKKRKEMIDAVSAQVILEEFLMSS